MKEFFKVNVKKYCQEKDFFVVRPASLNNPKNNSVMFIMSSHINQVSSLLSCQNCLVFWPADVLVPNEIKERHAVMVVSNPHTEYCSFFRDNQITFLPIKEDVELIDGAWISKKASIAKTATILPGAYIGGDCSIGDGSYIGAGAKLVGDVIIGKNVIIRENTVIGADGLTTDRDVDGKAITMPQFGGVLVEDDVQIGANVVIARGAIDNTIIHRGAKIDSCCFISHNVEVGDDSFVVGETIMFGSSSVGERTLISGNCTIANAVHIGSDSILGMSATALKDVPNGVIAFGSPVKTVKERM